MKFPVKAGKGSVKVVTIRSFEEEHIVADEVISGSVVLVDFKYIDSNIKQRILAFLEGTIFGIDGRMVVLRDDLVLLLPNGVLDEPLEKNPLEALRQNGQTESRGFY
ncbi:MAG: cell division protein SepF [Candidatus Margulisbacteria bacterium]|jgi:FtsZ-interacting cell division protein YlmF|nr:cell division protein SepF [Candidatus Margulisiibacteriota bacterium]